MDFFTIRAKPGKTKGSVLLYPDFRVGKTKDLLVKGNSFYAIWDESKGLWSTSEYDVQMMVDDELWKYRDEKVADGTLPENVTVQSLGSYSSGMWSVFVKYVREMVNCKVDLDTKLTFADTKTTRKDYASKRLEYSLNDGSYDSWDTLVGTLYSPEERTKIEWSIGAIVSGDSVDIQKFVVFYGAAGAGKSTILNIIQKLFAGYYVVFDAKELTSANNQFATEMFRSNPLVAIQHDGDLSRIEDNTKLNSIVSHEEIVINEKRKTKYILRPRCFLYMATNRPVKITDSKSGVIRRLIDIRPTGNKIPIRKYNALMTQIDFELGAIAKHCLDVYRELGKNYYDNYKPKQMQEQTDVFYNFVETYIDEFAKQDNTTLSQAYSMYKQYCDDSSIPWKMEKYKFKEELKSYFKEFEDDIWIEGKHIRNYYSGFIIANFTKGKVGEEAKEEETPVRLVLDQEVSLLDDILADMPAQYATNDEKEKPVSTWSDCSTKLRDIDTHKTHYVKVPKEMVVIDFDIRNESGDKDMEKNLEAASKWPATYAEFSKGGAGIHLHYFYTGDVSKLSSLYAEGIEVKAFRGNAALRRRLSKCNNIPVATIDSGLPLKEEKMINSDSVKSEVGLRKLIERNLKKEIHPGTKPSVDFIFKILEDAYNSGLEYDVSDMRQRIFRFAMGSTHQSDYCMKLVKKMKFKSAEEIAPGVYVKSKEDDRLVFFDIEVFPNLLLVNWKYEGEDSSVVRMVNPDPQDIEQLMKMKLVGFNCRKYDNHILYARYLGETNYQIYDRSRRIISGDSTAFFGEAYNISYTDVYDFSSKKQSLKKFEIELGIHHQELGLPWDEPVPEELWDKVAEYCDNDVIATEAVFNARHADFVAREILASVAGMTVNDTTNSLTTKIIFGGDRKPQSQFNYRNMGDESDAHASRDDIMTDKRFTVFDSKGRPIFPGYSYEGGKSIYRGEEVGEGGYVYAEPGIYRNVALLDIASMHPSSIVAEELFGEAYTARFKDILQARILIKHREFEAARNMLGGALAPYLDDENSAADLAQALKIAINSVYGLTSAKFDNPFHDIRNKDNIVAKRGALFMVNLKYEVRARGFIVAHIKTDSIKIPDATPEIIQFVMDYGKLYGYNFEHEATYDRMCLVNDAVYIAKYKGGKHDGEWTATGAEFQHPYIFKTLFSHEPIKFEDLCETKTVTSALYLDMNEGLEEGEHNYQFVGKAGLFTPIKSGCGGGILLREKDGKYYAATGSKGYRWLESEVVQALGKESDIDYGYFRKLVDDAIEHINEFGDYYEFVGESESSNVGVIGSAVVPCGDGKYNSCFDCPKFNDGICGLGYKLAIGSNERR